MASTTISQTPNVRSEYPYEADKYFLDDNIIGYKLPKSIRQDIESSSITVRFTSAKQYFDYIQNEITFWEKHDPDQKLSEYTRLSYLKSAKSDFLQAVDYYIKYPDSISTGNYQMNQSVGRWSDGQLYSKSRLARFFIKNLHKSKDFFIGFMRCISLNRNSSLPSSADALEGFIVALEYCKVIGQLVSASEEDVLIFRESAKQANENFEQLNADYANAFHSHKAKLEEFSLNMDGQFQTLKEEADKYYQEKERRCQELEALYEEKLKLQAPAEYWAEMDEHYTARGRLWLGISIGVTILTVLLLVFVLAFLPDLFNEESHWFEVFKNSAIITVITSVAVYMLRLFVKLCTSSFHLASDARERNKLSYFYLALMEKKAVSEKERAIILNSLFSRADTGMLKGDSSPTMSGNITDLVQNLNKGQ